MNHRIALVALVIAALGSFGCAQQHMQPQSPQSHPVKEEQQPPKNVDRSIEVEEGSVSDYTVRAGHAVVEAGQGAAEAAEDAYDWAREKKRRAKAWLHDMTAPEEKKNE